ncbi:MAG TPA: carboxypeptidase regulatory-like domain-containing protein [Bacteroidota bacterium]|nr:carboxypeptidase regulatory-like domain-containing protein [Bacteroidota bacterium]
MKKVHSVLFAAAAMLLFSPDAHAGDISGKISFKGRAPEIPQIKMNADKQCLAMHPKPVNSEDVVINSNGTLKNVFIYIKSGLNKKYDVPTTPVVLAQQGCQYRPHVFGIQAGQPLEIVNDDPLLHNIHALPKNSPQFNNAQPIKGMKMTKKFDKPEVMVKFKCEVHNWMNCYAGVVDNPFYAVSDDKGDFTIKGIPNGTYTIEVWHEKYGTQDMTVTVGDKGAKADFTYVGK